MTEYWLNLTGKDFRSVFEPKVYGSWLLHECTKSLDLDFFILQSSLLSLLGSAGQANYSAGNTFLDSLSAHRRSAGLPATAINWSAWSEGGLATRSGARGEAMWASLGVKFVSPDLAMQAFDRLMQRDVDQIAVAVADWSTYAGKVGKSPFLAELLNGSDGNGSSKSTRRKSALAASRVPVNGEARQQLFGRLQQRIMAELGFAEPIDPDRPLNEIGLDSLRSVTLANNLEDEFGILVSISELISGPTINQLSEYLSGLVAQSPEDETAGFHSAMPPVAAIRALATNSPVAVAQVNSLTDTYAAARGKQMLSKTDTETERCIILMPGQMERWCPPADPATEAGQIISIPEYPAPPERSRRPVRAGG